MSEVTARKRVREPEGEAGRELESRVLPVASRNRSSAAPRRLPILTVDAALSAQRSLTAVDRFALDHAHDNGQEGDRYRALLPLESPRPGEQYAFEVDLDACTGCKACVAACHTLNGLDPGETFRSVGLLTGGTPELPRIQTVTSSCHHCMEPACLTGCPVGAYEKDPLTGIVKHLDDQCIGCQYCTLMCPYDAPKYNEAKGIVRKCDMCSDRLGHGEAPACVQACPNEAIAIRIVEHAVIAAAAEARHFVRGAADRDGTLPTTSYKTTKATPDNLLPVDHYRTEVSPAHAPLVAMLVLTQWSVGASVVSFAFQRALGIDLSSLGAVSAATVVLGLGLFASILHLGRPSLAFRAVIGIKTSWLSREVLAFGLLMKLAMLGVLVEALPDLGSFPGRTQLEACIPSIRLFIPALGVLSVACSVMVYAATRRAPWSFARTALRFFGTAALLGCASTLMIAAVAHGASGALPKVQGSLLRTLLVVAVFKLSFDAWLMRDRSSYRLTGRARVGRVMLEQLRGITGVRVALLALGGVVTPAALMLVGQAVAPAIAAGACVALVAAELAERYLFFAAAPALRMPGSLR